MRSTIWGFISSCKKRSPEGNNNRLHFFFHTGYRIIYWTEILWWRTEELDLYFTTYNTCCIHTTSHELQVFCVPRLTLTFNVSLHLFRLRRTDEDTVYCMDALMEILKTMQRMEICVCVCGCVYEYELGGCILMHECMCQYMRVCCILYVQTVLEHPVLLTA